MTVSVHEVEVAGRTVRYRAAGEGETVVLLHGLSGSWRWWRRNVATLAEERRIVLVDLASLARTLRDAPDALATFVAAVGPARADVVGHSLGGLVALRLAARRPERVNRLVLVAPAALLPARRMREYVTPLAAALRAAGPRFAPLLAADALRAGPLALARTTRELLADDVRDELETARTPTLLVWGDRDTLVPLPVGRALEEALPDARLVVLPGAGHVPMFERPEEFARIVREFLADDPALDSHVDSAR